MSAKKKPKRNLFVELVAHVENLVEAAIAESWKGGGDPEAIPYIEAQLTLARAKFDYHITVMQRELQ